MATPSEKLADSLEKLKNELEREPAGKTFAS